MISRRGLLGASAGLGLLAACSSPDPTEPAPDTTTVDPSATPSSQPSTTSASPSTSPSRTTSASTTVSPTIAGPIATGLNVPWGICFLPNGDALVGERDSARILKVTAAGEVTEVGTVAGVQARTGSGEGGLLGLAQDPAQPDQLFAYFTTGTDNRVARLDLAGGLGKPEPILTGIPASTHHNGGALLFASGLLYVSTGDAGQREQAQDRNSLSGKILRVTPEGKAAPDNPFDNPVWSLGHRNVEGLALDEAGRIWATEFGDKEVDELNLITRGANYGWPSIEGPSRNPDFVSPKVAWKPTSSCSPAGVAITRSTAFVGALQGKCLFSVPLNGEFAQSPVAHFQGQFGRIRQVVVAPDGSLWLTTSNTDGRATPGPKDDQIIRVTL